MIATFLYSNYYSILFSNSRKNAPGRYLTHCLARRKKDSGSWSCMHSFSGSSPPVCTQKANLIYPPSSLLIAWYFYRQALRALQFYPGFLWSVIGLKLLRLSMPNWHDYMYALCLLRGRNDPPPPPGKPPCRNWSILSHFAPISLNRFPCAVIAMILACIQWCIRVWYNTSQTSCPFSWTSVHIGKS